MDKEKISEKSDNITNYIIAGERSTHWYQCDNCGSGLDPGAERCENCLKKINWSK